MTAETGRAMRVRVHTPTHTVLDVSAVKLVAEATNGSFCIEPRHIGFATALVASVLLITPPDGQTILIANDDGALVKRGREVEIAVRRAVRGTVLAQMRMVVAHEFTVYDDRERTARSALARLEAGVVRRYIDLTEGPR